ncbi:hypothetical protein Syun_023294 [Stephania yunnanensis]|uniref:Uncharacterized protein n=1 Tax=Stephania yunnanensis TaxID=152371 RepID=A0AAP0FGC2_9MAGN
MASVNLFSLWFLLQIAISRLQFVKTEKTKMEQKKELEEQDKVRLMKEKDHRFAHVLIETFADDVVESSSNNEKYLNEKFKSFCK